MVSIFFMSIGIIKDCSDISYVVYIDSRVFEDGVEREEDDLFIFLLNIYLYLRDVWKMYRILLLIGIVEICVCVLNEFIGK